MRFGGGGTTGSTGILEGAVDGWGGGCLVEISEELGSEGTGSRLGGGGTDPPSKERSNTLPRVGGGLIRAAAVAGRAGGASVELGFLTDLGSSEPFNWRIVASASAFALRILEKRKKREKESAREIRAVKKITTI